MDYTNNQLVQKAMGALDRLGIRDSETINKAAQGVIDTSVNYGGFLPRSSVIELLNQTRKDNDWLNSITNMTRQTPSGTFLVQKLSEPVTEGVGENEGKEITSKPETYQVEYTCRKYRSDIFITTEQLQEAAAGGIQNFESQTRSDFAKALGNDLADLTMNSDNSLDSSTRRNRLLRMTDGVRKRMNGANVHDAQGQAWGQGIFSAMQKALPSIYRNDPGLNYMYNPNVEIEWTKSLTNTNTTERTRSALGDRAISSMAVVPPLGKRQLIISQIGDDEGPAPIAPTSITDDTDGTMTIDLTTMVTASYFATAAAVLAKASASPLSLITATALAPILSPTRSN